MSHLGQEQTISLPQHVRLVPKADEMEEPPTEGLILRTEAAGRHAAMTASDTVTANPFANPLIPALGKTMRPVASMANPSYNCDKLEKS
jgi:hypothetical protein